MRENKPARKKILFILPSLEAGGAEKIITIIANSLDKTKFEPVLVLFQKKGIFLDVLDPIIPIIELNISRIRYSIFKIIPILRKEKPNMVFSGWGEISAFLSPIIPLFSKIKFIARETNVVSEHVLRREIRFFYRFYNNYHQIIAQSDDMRDDLVQKIKIKAKKIEKINNPVDFKMIQDKLDSEPNFSFPQSEKKNILAVGNLSYRKGFDHLIKVMSYVQNPQIHLHILGDGAQKDEFLEMTRDLNLETRITFWGMQKNPFTFMKHADLFVLSSRYEGFPNVLLEAGACGTFALANNCNGGIREIIQQENGRISDIKNHQEFAQKMEECLLICSDSEAIKKSIYDRYNQEKIMLKYAKVLSRV